MRFYIGMKIAISNYQPNNYTNFKAAYPVRYWVREADGSGLHQILDMKMGGSFQEEIIGFLNKLSPTKQNIKAVNKNKIKNKKLRPFDGMMQKLFDLLIERDVDYRQNMNVRSFYNRVVPGRNLFYFITGDHVADFNNKYAKPIGRAMREGKGQETPALTNAKNNFNYGGYQYVNDFTRRIKKDGRTEVLNILYEVERDGENKISGYKMADMNFTEEFYR